MLSNTLKMVLVLALAGSGSTSTASAQQYAQGVVSARMSGTEFMLNCFPQYDPHWLRYDDFANMTAGFGFYQCRLLVHVISLVRDDICLRSGVKPEQLIAVLRRDYELHPEHLDGLAIDRASTVFSRMFPCRR